MLPSSHADTRKKRVAFKALLGEVDLTFDQPEGQEPPHAAMDEVRRRLAGVSRAFETLKVAHDRLVTANAKLMSDNKAFKKERQELRAKAGELDALPQKLKDQHDRNNRLHGTLYDCTRSARRSQPSRRSSARRTRPRRTSELPDRSNATCRAVWEHPPVTSKDQHDKNN
ncbi:hypothetical protein A4X09_0g7038 [Tilletia walkeri]|uniref:Uncharacterized protein n=1 Tax=Tilletia walkeri TaxID=117179 RepID=A0A8X7N3Z4_9BASI|nr:hypothetical protein A4X09_0g7038 [Tilletia walkeri]